MLEAHKERNCCGKVSDLSCPADEPMPGSTAAAAGASTLSDRQHQPHNICLSRPPLLCSDVKQLLPYSPQSSALVLPSAEDASQQTVLPLFGAASASTSGSGLAADAANSSANAGQLTAAESRDLFLNAGGPVWALDWCPAGAGPAVEASAAAAADGSAAPAAEAAGSQAGVSHDYIAVGCHPLQATHNTIGTAVQGPACIQIWQISHPEQQQRPQRLAPPQAQAQQPSCQLPRMALGLAHDGGLTWHCQWCPSAALEDSTAAASGRSVGSDALPR